MTKAELSRMLYDLGVPSDVYRLDGSHFELAYVLRQDRGSWIVFLSERGGESDGTVFEDEHEACVNIFGRICLELVARGQLTVGEP